MTNPGMGRGQPVCAGGKPLLFRANDGLTIVELLVVLVIISILSSLSVVAYTDALEEARVTRAIVEIRQIEKELMHHETEGSLPDSPSDIGLGGLRDPWTGRFVRNLVMPVDPNLRFAEPEP